MSPPRILSDDEILTGLKRLQVPEAIAKAALERLDGEAVCGVFEKFLNYFGETSCAIPIAFL
jgi:hypothetical protein